jgi:large subunit ribosomal protein L9
MKVILTMDVAEVGARGDRLDVSAGYARNYLLPRQLAVLDTPGNVRRMAEDRKLGAVRSRKERAEAERVGEWLAQHEIFTTLKIGGEGKAFGAVTAKDLAVLLGKAGLEVDRRRIRLDAPIKRLGVFQVPIAIHPEVDTHIRLFIDRESGSKEGASNEQAAFDAEVKATQEASRIEAEARAAREKEAEEATRVAIERAAARRAREEEEAKAREEARRGKPLGEVESDEPAAAARREGGEDA